MYPGGQYTSSLFYLSVLLSVCLPVYLCPGLRTLALPSLTMLNLDWTCVTTQITLQSLVANGMYWGHTLSPPPPSSLSLTFHLPSGCYVLETLRNRNICQELPGSRRPHPARGLRQQQADDDDDDDMVM